MAQDHQQAAHSAELDRRHDGKLPRIDPSWPGGEDGHAVTELVAQSVGGLSPFGDDVRFPLPVEALRYEHPTARPNR